MSCIPQNDDLAGRRRPFLNVGYSVIRPGINLIFIDILNRRLHELWPRLLVLAENAHDFIFVRLQLTPSHSVLLQKGAFSPNQHLRAIGVLWRYDEGIRSGRNGYEKWIVGVVSWETELGFLDGGSHADEA